jgi:hypothetical protein
VIAGACRAAARLSPGAAHLDGRPAQEAGYDLVAIVVFHEHELSALGIGALNGKDHGRRTLGR